MVLNYGQFPPLRPLAMSGDIFHWHNYGNSTVIWWIEVRDAANHPTMPILAPHNQELSGPESVPTMRNIVLK